MHIILKLSIIIIVRFVWFSLYQSFPVQELSEIEKINKNAFKMRYHYYYNTVYHLKHLIVMQSSMQSLQCGILSSLVFVHVYIYIYIPVIFLS